MRRECIKITVYYENTSRIRTIGCKGRYIGNPMDGYTRHDTQRGVYGLPEYLSWQMIQDLVKMHTYEVEFLTKEEFFLESL